MKILRESIYSDKLDQYETKKGRAEELKSQMMQVTDFNNFIKMVTQYGYTRQQLRNSFGLPLSGDLTDYDIDHDVDLVSLVDRIIDDCDFAIDMCNKEISELQEKEDNYDSVRNRIIKAITDNGYNVDDSDDNLIIYDKFVNDNEYDYDLMHDIKDLLESEMNDLESDMGMFIPTRGSAWTTLDLKCKNIKFKLSARSSGSSDGLVTIKFY